MMAQLTFNLPDLGEGLQEAEIVSWHVKPGQQIVVDAPLLAVETAKAVVEVPSPFTGVVSQLHAREGDVVAIGAPLLDVTGSGAAAVAQDPERDDAPVAAAAPSDSGSVVGATPISEERLERRAIPGKARAAQPAKAKAAPAVRALAKRLGVDLAVVTPTGRHGQVLPDDVRSYAMAAARAPATSAPEAGERLRGATRSMAQSMSAARDEIALCTVVDDADIHAWHGHRDITARLLRAVAAGVAAEPALNGFFHTAQMSHHISERVDVALAVDTPEGLMTPVIRDVPGKSLTELRSEVAELKRATKERRLAPEQLLNYTITLSNFGMLAGRYATPIMVPPTIAILAAGTLQDDVVPALGGIEVHPRIPLSLSFDHRCINGGQACRFLAAVIGDLRLAD
jgi:pyruvate dehydrogenase E2 component (dihydrolipoamide acetyltransferase)